MNTAGAVAALLASAVIILGGVAALVRFMWRIALAVRDNTRAVTTLTKGLGELRGAVDGRFDDLVERVGRLEGRRRPRL